MIGLASVGVVCITIGIIVAIHKMIENLDEQPYFGVVFMIMVIVYWAFVVKMLDTYCQ